MKRPFDARLVLFVFVFLILDSALGSGAYAAPHIRVRGALRLDCHAGRRHGFLVVEGRTLDDAGRAVGGHPLRVALPTPSHDAHACGAPSARLEMEGDKVLRARSDESGRFCVEAELPIGAYDVTVDATATELLEPARAELAVDLSKRAVRLRFDPEPHVITLDTFSGTLDAIADEEGEGASEGQTVPAVNLPLELRDERGAVIARATTQANGRASFSASSSSLGAPGRGELIVAFAGSADVMPSEHAQPVERRAWVTLTAPASASGTPEDGVAFDVGVRTRFGDVSGGAVEALFGGTTVGAASVSQGSASVLAVFASARQTPHLTLRYVPDRPWYVPSSTVTIPIEVKAPSPLRQLPLVFGALAALAWLLVGRAKRKRRAMETTIAPKPTFEGAPRVALVEESAPGKRDWIGRVLDAHDGAPVASARVAIQRPAFQERQTFASALTRGDGSFELRDVPAGAGLVLVAEGPLHRAHEQPLPNPGTLEIALVSRRRRLLDRLVDWARRRGFDGKLEPTPLQVQRAANDEQTAAWAEAVERAAFDDVVVDAQAEQEVERLEPPP